MPGPLVAVINESTVLTDTDVAAVVPALQHQVTYHWSPHWHEPCHLATYLPGTAPATAWQLVLLDDSDQAGALGYHDLTSAGLPLAKVFAKTDQQYGYNWTVTTSHELLEMLGDPQIDRDYIPPVGAAWIRAAATSRFEVGPSRSARTWSASRVQRSSTGRGTTTPRPHVGTFSSRSASARGRIRPESAIRRRTYHKPRLVQAF